MLPKERSGARAVQGSQNVASAPKAKHIVYLFQSGGPPQMVHLDHKPHLDQVHGQDVPESIIDEVTVINSMHIEPINYDPAITFFQTGFQLTGCPSFNSWMS